MSTLTPYGRADYLYADSGFLGGVASLVDLTGTLVYYNASHSPAAADRLALMQDWYCVGDAFREAMGWANSQVPSQAGAEDNGPVQMHSSLGA
jgi:hypothetical protein